MSRERRRILVGLDSSPGSLRVLEEAAELAERLDAELVGIFVEDDNLLRLARLPQSSEVGRRSARSRNLDPDAIARLFRRMAARAQRELAAAAERHHLRSSFEVARGSVTGQLLRALAGENGEAGASAATTTSRPRRLGAERAASIILMQGQVCVFPKGKAVIVLDDHHSSAARLPECLDLADESCTDELLFLVVGDSLINARRQVLRVRELLSREGRSAQIKMLAKLEPEHLLALLTNEACGTLIFSACRKIVDRELLRWLSEQIDYPIFLVGE